METSSTELDLIGVLRRARGRAYVSHDELFAGVAGNSVSVGRALESLILAGVVGRVDDHLFRFALLRDPVPHRARLSALAAVNPRTCLEGR